MSTQEFLSAPLTKTLTDRGRALIASNGSLTRLLEALYLKEINIEVKNQGISPQSNGSLKLLGISENEEVMTRDVWLVDGNKKLVFAHSVIPVKILPSNILKKLTPGKEPLGSILEKEDIFCKKNFYEFARLKWKDIAKGFNLPEDYVFWARRYRISTQSGIIAAIMEVFPDYLF